MKQNLFHAVVFVKRVEYFLEEQQYEKSRKTTSKNRYYKTFLKRKRLFCFSVIFQRKDRENIL